MLSSINTTESILNLVNDFFNVYSKSGFEIYNEASFQHELGYWLRTNLRNCVVQFERNVAYFFPDQDKRTFIKKEIDLVIIDSITNEKYAIELKNPRNGEVPNQMFAFLTDLLFVEQLVDSGFTAGLSIVLVDDHKYVRGRSVLNRPSTSVYEIFRSSFNIEGRIAKPTDAKKKTIDFLIFTKPYKFKWIQIKEKEFYYTILVK